jgi:hypothetical protein
MPGGKAPIVGVAPAWCHERTLPPEVGDPQSLLKWRRPDHPKPTIEQCEHWRLQIREAMAKYLAFKDSTRLFTVTERNQRIREARGNPDALDINTRVIKDRRQRYGEDQYGIEGPKFRDPLLPALIIELEEIWRQATGRSASTRDPEPPGEFPFHDWILDLFQACRKEAPKAGAVRDILERVKTEKSGP